MPPRSTWYGCTEITNFGHLLFYEKSSAGVSSIGNLATLVFSNVSTAANSKIDNNLPDGNITFKGRSTAGNAQITTQKLLTFDANSNAGDSTISNSGGLRFIATSTAGNAKITNQGTLTFDENSTARGDENNTARGMVNTGTLAFIGESRAGNAIITNNDAGIMRFCSETKGAKDCHASLDHAKVTNNKSTNDKENLVFAQNSEAGKSVITNAGTISFKQHSSGGQATINNSGNVFFEADSQSSSVVLNNTSAAAVVDLSSSKAQNKPMSAASIEGDGSFLLGSSVFMVGSNNTNTTVTGAISDGGKFKGTGAKFGKVGTGTLTLNGKNTWTGDTTVYGGKLVANGKELLPGRYGPPPEFQKKGRNARP